MVEYVDAVYSNMPSQAESENCLIQPATNSNRTSRLTKSREELSAAFTGLSSYSALCSLLEVTPRQLAYYTHDGSKYTQIEIAKRHGGVRKIMAPVGSLKIIQRKLNEVLQAAYKPTGVVHGFVDRRGIVTNASPHCRIKYVLNVDLADFFPTITFARVRGMFMGKPYNLPANIATVLARLCTFKGELPQGAPTSPTVSNMLMARFDSEAKKLAMKHRCRYSRYADDITFSTYSNSFPRALAFFAEDESGGTIQIGHALEALVEKNKFSINPDKTRLQHSSRRQSVTGLTVNRRPNVPQEFVRQVRAMLFAWKKFGIDNAACDFFKKYDYQERSPEQPRQLFQKVVKGKIDFIGSVRGRDSRSHLALLQKYADLDHGYKWPADLPPRELSLNALQTAVFAIRSSCAQGTAFSIGKKMLITCAHVVNGQCDLHVVRQDEYKEFAVEVVHVDPDRDLAIVRFQDKVPPQMAELSLHLDAVETLDQITLLGYPTSGPSVSCRVENGAIAGYYTRFGQTRYEVTCTIYQGNSGGPVLDRSYRVIGVAANGKAKLASKDGELNGVIPAATLHLVLESWKK